MQTLRERVFSGDYYAHHGRGLGRTFVFFIIGVAILAGLDALGWMNFDSTVFTVLFFVLLLPMFPFMWHMAAIFFVPIVVLSFAILAGILKAPFFFIWSSSEE